MAKVVNIPAGTKGFDCNTLLTYQNARRFFNKGYSFAIRYVGREKQSHYDLSLGELTDIHKAGLGLMIVQHVESETSWFPNPYNGTKYGYFAARISQDFGILPKTNIWLDLEGVNLKSSPADIIKYCNNWYWAVQDAGFTPGVYVGWHSGLTAKELFVHLAFQHYWGAYNLNKDEEPQRRGLQMKQSVPRHDEIPLDIDFQFDIDTVHEDELLGLPLAFVPDEWSVI